MPSTPLHIAFPVNDHDAARTFYGTILGCPDRRSSAKWIDFNFFGHQVVQFKAFADTGQPLA